MIFEKIKKEFNKELIDINNFIKENLKTNVTLIDNIGNYLTSYGGKKIRPLINLLFAKILNSYTRENIIISSAIELIHTATLLHDDVVDMSEKRRNKLTVNTVWGNKEAILVGDFLYTKSFKMLVCLNNITILNLMSNTTNIMSEGEIKQLIHRKNFNIKEAEYIDIIRCKTAELFAASSLSSAILAQKDKKYLNAAYIFGIHFGIAYQLIDDMLDYFADDEKFGKNIYDDICVGTFTLPLINLITNNKYKRKMILNIILKNEKKDFIKIKDLIINSRALYYTFDLAVYHIDKAKKALSIYNDSKFLKLIYNLINFTINRKY